MQNMTIYLQLDGIRGERTDAEGNLLRAKAPEITRGINACLEVRLRDGSGNPWQELELYDAWEFYAGDDYDPATPVMLGVTEGITAENDCVSIPVNSTNTPELAAALGSSEQIRLHAELLGFIGRNDAPALVIQFEITVRNRVALSGTETPDSLPQIYLTAGAVKALVAEETKACMPRINADGNWEVAGVDTNVPVTGPAGAQGEKGEKGDPGEKGEKGDTGPKGDPMKIDATGTAAELTQYDSEAKGFSFLATDTGMVYIKNSDTEGDWSEPVGFQGPAGKDGVTPERGKDYWTEEDISTIKSYVDEAIINGEW